MILEISLSVLVILFALGAFFMTVPMYVHKVMSKWRNKRRLYALRITAPTGEVFLIDGGKASLELWESVPKYEVHILGRRN